MRHVLQDEPGHPKAVAGLARCYLKSGDVERAKNTLAARARPTTPPTKPCARSRPN